MGDIAASAIAASAASVLVKSITVGMLVNRRTLK